MPWPRRVSHRPFNAEAQVRSQDAALNSVADSGPLGVGSVLSHRSVLVTVQTHTSPTRYQSFGHTQRNCSYTLCVRLSSRAVGPLQGSSCSCRKVWGKWEKAKSGRCTGSAPEWWHKCAPCHATRRVQPGSLLNRTAINIEQETFLKPQPVELLVDPTNNKALELRSLGY
jgi:hypothetical protein